MLEESRRAWLKLLRLAGVVIVVIAAVIQVIAGELIPPLLAFAVLFLVGLYVLRSRERAGTITLGILALLFFGLNIPFIAESLAHPSSWADFVPTVIGILASISAIIAAVSLLRGAGKPAVAALIGRGAIAVAVVAAVFSVFSTVTVDDVVAQSGDIELVAENVEWVPDELQASSDGVAIHIDNKDLFRHTFVVDDADVEEELTPGKGARVEFTLEPGEYEFYCSVPGHEDMKGTLTIE